MPLKIPIGVAIGMIVGVVYFISLAVWIATLQTSMDSASDLASRLRTEVAGSLLSRIEERVRTAETITRTNALQFKNGAWIHPDRPDPRGPEVDHFLTAFRGILYGGKFVTTVSMTDYRGNLFGVYNNFDFTFAGMWEQAADNVTGLPVLWDYETYGFGDPREGQKKQLVAETNPYNSSEQVWYTVCNFSDPNSGAWTPMYTMGTVGTVTAMLSQSHVAFRPDGSLIGVVSIDMATGFIGSILSTYTSKTMFSFVVDATLNDGLGVFLGSSRNEVIMKCNDPAIKLEDCVSVNQTVKLPMDSSDLTVLQYDEALRGMYGGWDAMPDLETAYGTDLVSVASVVRNKLQWRIILIVPQASYLGSVLSNRNGMIGVQVACFVVTVIICILFAAAVRAPLKCVIESMEDLQCFITDTDLAVADSMLLEVAQMQQSNLALRSAMTKAKSFVPQSLLAELRGELNDDEEEGGAAQDSGTRASSLPKPGENYVTKLPHGRQSRAPSQQLGQSDRFSEVSRSSRRSAASSSRAKPIVGDIAMSKKRISVLCLNVRRFHTLAFALPPDGVAKLMAKVVSAVFTIVTKDNRGMLDYFQGDHFVVSFNAVTNLATHVRRSVACAIQLQTKLKTLHDSLDATIGLSAGVGVVGNIGSEEVKRFGIISPAYTQAAKLERRCRAYHQVPILCVSSIMDEDAKAAACAEEGLYEITDRRRIVSCPRSLIGHDGDEEWMYKLRDEEGKQTHNDRFLAWLEGAAVPRENAVFTEPAADTLPTPQELFQRLLNEGVDGKSYIGAVL
jgi:class 3 adenylate cyclase